MSKLEFIAQEMTEAQFNAMKYMIVTYGLLMDVSLRWMFKPGNPISYIGYEYEPRKYFLQYKNDNSKS